jgi:hypothetical protein
MPMITASVGNAAPSYRGNSISSDSMPMMWLSGGDTRSDKRIKFLRDTVETTRAVRIKEKPKVHSFSWELSKKEKKTVWYTKKDLKEMLESNRALIQLSRKSPGLDTCTRGLEDMMSIRANIAKKERIKTVLHAVLEEQKRQKAEESRNPEKLRKRSKNGSKESIKRSLIFAHKDAKAVFEAGEDIFNSSMESFSIPESMMKKVPSCDDSVMSATTATTSTTFSTVSTFDSSFRRRAVESVVQQPHAPKRGASPKANMPPTSVIIDHKCKRLVLSAPKSGSGHRSTRTRRSGSSPLLPSKQHEAAVCRPDEWLPLSH